MTDVAETRAVSVSDDHAAVSGRAAIAKLTMQLRAAQQELAQEEAAAEAADQSAARLQVRSKIDPMLEERRRALDAELAKAREEARTTVASARRRAEMLMAWFDHGGNGTAVAAPTPAGNGGDGLLLAAIRGVLRELEAIDVMIVEEPARIRAAAAAEAERIVAEARRALVPRSGGHDAG